MSRCPNVCENGPQCERIAEHNGCHRNGLLFWHDPPLLIVGGETVKQQTLFDRQPAALQSSSQLGIGDPWPEGF